MSYHHIDDIFERMTYPAGERHIRLSDGAASKLQAGERAVIEFNARCFDDLAQLVVADRVLNRNGVAATWFVPYFPFARHDRRNDVLDGFELGLAMEMLSEVDVVIADPHSDVAGQLRHIGQSSAVEVFRSAGGTFLGLAEELRTKHAGPLTLAVTHGLFSKGLTELSAAFDHIYSFQPRGSEPGDAISASESVTRIPFQILYEKGAQQ